MMKKAMELSFNVIVVAVICLVVLIVILAIFSGTITEIAKKFQGQTEKAGESGDNAIDDLGLFACNDGQFRCNGNSLERCSNERWQVEEECENGCRDKACQ